LAHERARKTGGEGIKYLTSQLGAYAYMLGTRMLQFFFCVKKKATFYEKEFEREDDRYREGRGGRKDQGLL
jgi:hypothetical protein